MDTPLDSKWTDGLRRTDRMPVLFLGHGSPMNAVEENIFVQGFRDIAKQIPVPQAILVVSAHWETEGTRITAMAHPRTIHDFGGFPPALYQENYPAPGAPGLAALAKALLTETSVRYDYDWGLDHGAWTVLKHLYPEARIPVVQMSIDFTRAAQDHYALGRQLARLRERGVLIIGSGNMVHNLFRVDWAHIHTIGHGHEWAWEARERINRAILQRDHRSLIAFAEGPEALKLAIPTREHFLPLLYVTALQGNSDEVHLFNDQVLAGSLSMTSVMLR